MDEREAAWFALHDALPPGWRVGEVTYDPASAEYVVTAMSPRPVGRGRPPDRVIVGRGADEVTAVAALAETLRVDLNTRARAAFIEGADEDSRRRLGRGLTAEELERVLRHYPGDPRQRDVP
jgi:hypothetical protein